jgi:hypothetical protein
MSPRNIALWCVFPLAIGIIVDSLELVADRVQLREGGIYGYSVLATGRPVLLARPLAPILGLAFRYPNVLSLAYWHLLYF